MMAMRLNEKAKILVVLLVVVLLGGLLRLFYLDKVPAGLHIDEAQSGYNAFLLLHTGKNINGQKWPIDIDYYGDFRPAINSYLTAVSISIMDLNVFSTRLPAALFSTGLILLTYVFATLLFRNRKIGALSAFLVAVSPYGVIFGRSSADAAIDICWEMLALIFLLLGLKQKRLIYFLFTWFFWTVGYFTSQTSRSLTPLFGVATIILAFREYGFSKKLFFLAFLPVVAYLIFPFGYFLRTPFGLGRFNQVSVFAFPGTQWLLDENIREDGTNAYRLVSRVFHNKIVGYTYDIASRYTVFFSPNPGLFSIPQPDRYFVEGVGAFTLIEYLGLILALAAVIYKKPPSLSVLPLVLVLLAPLPSAVTFEAAPNFLRSVFMVPFWQITAAFGLATAWTNFKSCRRFFLLPLLFITMWQLSYFLHQYLVHQPNHFDSIKSRATEMQVLATFLKREHDQNLAVLLSEYDGPSIYYFFYNKIILFDTKVTKPGKYFSQNYSIDNMDFHAGPCAKIANLLNKHYQVLILRDECLRPQWAKKIADFYRSDGTLGDQAYDLRSSQEYNDYFSLTSDEERLRVSKNLEKGLVNKDYYDVKT